MRSTRARLVLAGLAVAFVVTAAVSPMRTSIHGDGYYTYLWARSLAYDLDLDLTNDYALCGDPWRMSEPLGPGLGVRNQWNPGPAFVWAPILAVMRLVHPDRASPDPIVSQACRGPLADAALWGTVLMSILALLLIYRMARRHVPEGAALFAVTCAGFATPLTYYGAFQHSYGHAPAAFAVALFLERWDATRHGRTWKGWLLLGALLGFAMLMRPQNALVVIAPLYDWIAAAAGAVGAGKKKELLRQVGLGFLFVAAIVAAFSPQLWIWNDAYGTPFAVPQGPHYMRWDRAAANFHAVLFASTGGLLFWTPLLYVSFAGLFIGAWRRASRSFVLPLVVILIVSTYVNAAVWDFWGSAGFSNRRMTSLAAVYGVGFAVAFDALFRAARKHPQRVAGAFAALVVGVFVIGQYGAIVGVASGQIRSARERRSDYVWQTIIDQVKQAYDVTGNPLTYPASIPFALRYGAHPRQYDVMYGQGVFYAEYQDRHPRPQEAQIGLVDERGREYVVDGFGDAPRSVEGRTALILTGERGRILLPMFIEGYAGVEVQWSRLDERPARVRLGWEGGDLGPRRVPSSWGTSRWFIPPRRARAGVVELAFEREGGGPVAISGLRILTPAEVADAMEPPAGE